MSMILYTSSIKIIHYIPLIRSNRLRFTIAITPRFNTSEQRLNTPVPGMTTLLLHSPDPLQASAFVQLLDFALMGVNFVPIHCSVGVDVNTSSFTVTFDYFGSSSLYYNPGKEIDHVSSNFTYLCFTALSLLLGQSEYTEAGKDFLEILY